MKSEDITDFSANGGRRPGTTNPPQTVSCTRFDSFQQRLVRQATGNSSYYLNRFYRYSPREFFHFSYDVATEDEIPPEQLKTSVFAETLSYRRENHPQDFFRVNLCDHAILEAVRTRKNALALYPFLLYILTHELIHISRLSRLDLGEITPEKRREEEKTVHRLTREILAPASSYFLRRVEDLYHQDLLP